MDKLIYYGGIILMVFGITLLLGIYYPSLPFAAVSFGPAKLEGIPNISATRIFIGILFVLLGFLGYKKGK